MDSGNSASPVRKAAERIIDEFGSSDKQRIKAVLHHPIGDRQGQMRLPTPCFPTKIKQHTSVTKSAASAEPKSESRTDGLLHEIEIIKSSRETESGLVA
jgi:hypothetical protein